MNLTVSRGNAVLFAAVVGIGFANLDRAAEAQTVAIAAAASSNLADPRYTDPQAKILATGHFTAVDIIDVINQTPTLAELLEYDAIITWSNVNYFDNVALGNVFADYVDAGGGVVVAPFANSTTTANRYLDGRWITDGYEIIPSQSGNLSTSTFLGFIHDPNHPIMENVIDIGGSTMFRPVTTALTAHGVKIAEWVDGTTAAAVSTKFPNRADLGLYPPSADVVSTWWVGDGAELLANALLYVISDDPVPCPGDLTGDGNVGVADLLQLLSCWGPVVAGCEAADLTGDNNVGVGDLLELLGNWGPCP